MAEKISIEWRKKIKRKEEDVFFRIFPKKKQKQAAYAANEDDSEENPGTFEISVFRTFEISADNSEKIVKDFFGLCRDLRENQIPSSPVAEAATYALNLEKELKEFLENPKLNIDNNPAEAMQRAVSIGCRNWLFTGSEVGGQNLAILYSFSNTCKANDVNFRNWLEDVLPRLNSTPHDQIDSLLPHLWKQQNKL